VTGIATDVTEGYHVAVVLLARDTVPLVVRKVAL